MKNLSHIAGVIGLIALAILLRREITIEPHLLERENHRIVPEHREATIANVRNTFRPTSARSFKDTVVAEGVVEPVTPTGVESTDDVEVVDDALEQIVQNISEADLLPTLEKALRDNDPAMTELRDLLFARWAKSDTAAAATWAEQLPEGELRNMTLEQIAIAWMNLAPASASEWVKALPPGESQSLALFAAAYEASRTEPQIALELAAQFAPSPERDELLNHALSQWATVDFELALAWAREVPDDVLRQDLLATLAIARAETDAATSAAIVATGLATGDAQSRAAVSVVQRWAQNLPAEAAAWVTEFPDVPLRQTAVENLVNLWAARDIPTATAWVNSLPNGSLRDVATITLNDFNRFLPESIEAPTLQ